MKPFLHHSSWWGHFPGKSTRHAGIVCCVASLNIMPWTVFTQPYTDSIDRLGTYFIPDSFIYSELFNINPTHQNHMCSCYSEAWRHYLHHIYPYMGLYYSTLFSDCENFDLCIMMWKKNVLLPSLIGDRASQLAALIGNYGSESIIRHSHFVYFLIMFSTHCGRDKLTPVRRRHFQMHFLEWKCLNSD